ncbi:uncharacterized protein LOC125236190 [Leguminivora glycinivorella]|uniref:uncharacterized protein LOC125236190 n=1 Tax=Leguminivora glycinivorella TaxID=1035111 RepID=UPI002010B00E|nr:uncharacterized protein LOC125236190 [Leguminivora glycinivorella]
MSPAAEKPLKICIRGLPADTDHRKLQKDLRERDFDPILTRYVPARDKGPGIFCMQLQMNPKTSTVFEVKKLLDLPVRVEAWRGRQGPPQCQRCQGFRHSAAECLREYRCVHCARPHPSKNCNRPYDIPTCANCSGPHAANDFSCPAMRREEIAKKGMVLRTSGYTLATPKPVDESNAKSSLMAEANANWLSSQRKRRRRKTQAKDRLSASPERPESSLKEQETQAAPKPVLKKPVPVMPVSNEVRKSAVPVMNKPKPVSEIIEEALAASKSTKESKQLPKKSSPTVSGNTHIPVQEVQLVVDPVLKKKPLRLEQEIGPTVNRNTNIPVQEIQQVVDPILKESVEQQTQQVSTKPLQLEKAKPVESPKRPDPVRTKVVQECLLVLSSVLSAIQEGDNPVPIILEGIANLCQGA